MGDWQFVSSAPSCENSTLSPADKCVEWSNKFAVTLFFNPFYVLIYYFGAPICPCNILQASRDSQFIVDFNELCAYSTSSDYTFGQVNIMNAVVIITLLSSTFLLLSSATSIRTQTNKNNQ